MRNRFPILLLPFFLTASIAAFVHCGGESSTDAPGNDGGNSNTDAPSTVDPSDGSNTNDSATPADASVDAARYCDLGVARGDSTGGTVKLFDAEGNPIPTGHYRIAYVGGCMRYGGGQSFTVHAYEPSADAAAPGYASWVLVNADAGMQPVRLPGYWIFGDGGDAGGPNASYETCVGVNKTAPPVEFEYDGGVPLGVRINDNPLGDNTPGPDGGDPTWRLERLSPTGVCP